MAQSNDKLKSMIGELLNDLGKDDDDGTEDEGLFLDQQSKPYLSRMNSFPKKDRTNFNDVFDSSSLGDIDTSDDNNLFNHSPKLQYFDTKKKSKNVFVGMGFGSVIGFDEEEESSKGGLFDDVEDEGSSAFGTNFTNKKKTYTSSTGPVKDYSEDLFGEKPTVDIDDNQQQQEDLDAGLDKLLEGRKSQKNVFAFGTGILSEQDLIRSHVASHRTKEEIAAILAAVPPEVIVFCSLY